MGGLGSGRRRDTDLYTTTQVAFIRVSELKTVERGQPVCLRLQACGSQVFTLWTMLSKCGSRVQFWSYTPLLINTAVRLVHSKQHLGGFRTRFACPENCGRQVQILYLKEKLACRRCHRLVYVTQRLRAPQRALYRAQNRREALGGSPNMFLPFPSKPPGMHWLTYEHLEYEDARLNLLNLQGPADRKSKSDRKMALATT
jgi:hypothetical protein